MQTSNHFNSPPKLVQYLETRTSRGMLSKGWYEQDGALLLVKGNGDIGGYEPQSEVLVSNLLDQTDIPHVKYWLEPASKYPDVKTFGLNEYVSVCESYLTEDIREIITFYNYVNSFYQTERPRDYWAELLKLPEEIQHATFTRLHIDAIVGNQDRHLNNWDLCLYLDGSLSLSPLFDFGAALLSWETISYSNFSRGISPDRGKPFADVHAKQIKLLSRHYSARLHFDLGLFIQQSEAVLSSLGNKRRECVLNYLSNRLEVYSHVGSQVER